MLSFGIVTKMKQATALGRLVRMQRFACQGIVGAMETFFYIMTTNASNVLLTTVSRVEYNRKRTPGYCL